MLQRFLRRNYSQVVYKQGQENHKDPKIREYFYFVDHNGMLFLDDSHPVFLTFFLRNLKHNPYSDYKDAFPYVSLCGVERNYTRCDDLPIVFTKLTGSTLHYGYYTDKLTVNFFPEKLQIASNGRLYHPTFLKLPKVENGLLRSQLVMDLSSKLIYDTNNKAIGIRWDGKETLFSIK
ncbi:UPF0598 protein F59C6.12-like isoform X2 [Folsomia candida]|uniref:UPF0598 protein F59C6.12-like isoform X2 n=1 Tax=Folsomia candida TaxID=158441 RepID=UPI000B8F48FC|nr:UPF0598 protein F59C6.12-like isoform X2 [Folsomia candida]